MAIGVSVSYLSNANIDVYMMLVNPFFNQSKSVQ